jgi:hypothetical protein
MPTTLNKQNKKTAKLLGTGVQRKTPHWTIIYIPHNPFLCSSYYQTVHAYQRVILLFSKKNYVFHYYLVSEGEQIEKGHFIFIYK